jgi:hypothetical protein
MNAAYAYRELGGGHVDHHHPRQPALPPEPGDVLGDQLRHQRRRQHSGGRQPVGLLGQRSVHYVVAPEHQLGQVRQRPAAQRCQLGHAPGRLGQAGPGQLVSVRLHT